MDEDGEVIEFDDDSDEFEDIENHPTYIDENVVQIDDDDGKWVDDDSNTEMEDE